MRGLSYLGDAIKLSDELGLHKEKDKKPFPTWGAGKWNGRNMSDTKIESSVWIGCNLHSFM